MAFSGHAANPGDIIITEIMQNPHTVSDTKGEWFEIYNTTGTDINLINWTIKDNDSDEHLISSGTPLIIPAEGFLVLGRNQNSTENGGYFCNYQYASFLLSNGADEIVLLDETGREIDRVEYDGGSNWPDPNGASMTLINFTFDNNDGHNWTVSQSRQTSFTGTTGDFGSPGTLGSEQQLPVLLIDFSVTPVTDAALIRWQTDLEIDNLGFKIQRAESEGKQFRTISPLIPAQNGSMTSSIYSYLDCTVKPGESYSYRLMDISLNGSVTFHPAVSFFYEPDIVPDQFSILSVFPNPFSAKNSGGEIKLRIGASSSESGNSAVFTLVNLLGRIVYRTQLDLRPGKSSYLFRIPRDTAAGRYFCLIQAGNRMASYPLVIF